MPRQKHVIVADNDFLRFGPVVDASISLVSCFHALGIAIVVSADLFTSFFPRRSYNTFNHSEELIFVEIRTDFLSLRFCKKMFANFVCLSLNIFGPKVELTAICILPIVEHGYVLCEHCYLTVLIAFNGVI